MLANGWRATNLIQLQFHGMLESASIQWNSKFFSDKANFMLLLVWQFHCQLHLKTIVLIRKFSFLHYYFYLYGVILNLLQKLKYILLVKHIFYLFNFFLIVVYITFFAFFYKIAYN